MKKLIASAKPGSRIIRIGRRYIVNTTMLVRRVKYFDIMRSLVRKHYRTTMIYNKKHINRVFIYAGLPVPAYKDSQVTEIVLLIKSMSKRDSGEIAQAVIDKFMLCSSK